MKKREILYNSLTVLVIGLLVAYSYYSILALGFDTGGSSLIAFFVLSIIVITIYVSIRTANKVHTSFSRFWLVWIIWFVFSFYILGSANKGIADVFHVVFAPTAFFFFYITSLYSNKTIDISKIGFLILYVVAVWLNITNLDKVLLVKIGEETINTNLVYWCLCPFPFLLLLKKPIEQVAVIGLTIIVVLITGKRSAAISMAIIVLIYIVNISHRRYILWNIMGILIGGAALFFVTEKYLTGTFWGFVERFNDLSTDEGSGRVYIYNAVFKVLNENSIIDWIFGRGFGSIHLTGFSCAHNDPLQLLLENGIIGLFFYIIMIFHLMKRMLILRKKRSVYFVSYAASVIITIVLGVVSDLVVFYSYFAFLCAFWGMMEANMIRNGQLTNIYINI